MTKDEVTDILNDNLGIQRLQNELAGVENELNIKYTELAKELSSKTARNSTPQESPDLMAFFEKIDEGFKDVNDRMEEIEEEISKMKLLEIKVEEAFDGYSQIVDKLEDGIAEIWKEISGFKNSRQNRNDTNGEIRQIKSEPSSGELEARVEKLELAYISSKDQDPVRNPKVEMIQNIEQYITEQLSDRDEKTDLKSLKSKVYMLEQSYLQISLAVNTLKPPSPLSSSLTSRLESLEEQVSQKVDKKNISVVLDSKASSSHFYPRYTRCKYCFKRDL